MDGHLPLCQHDRIHRQKRKRQQAVRPGGIKDAIRCGDGRAKAGDPPQKAGTYHTDQDDEAYRNTANHGSKRLAGIPTEHIAGAIERITTSQLRHFSDQNQINTPSYPLHIELPIKNGLTPNFVQIEIDKDASTEEQAKQDRRWLVKLKFDFEETGRFDARASIQANKVGILFAAEDPETVQILRQNIPVLKQQLTDKNIEVERLDAFQAKLDKEKTNVSNTQSLIDVRT